MNDPVQFNLQGMGYKLEYLTQSFLSIVNQILITQETIANVINGLDTNVDTVDVIYKEKAPIIAEIEKSRDLVNQLRAFTGYKEK